MNKSREIDMCTGPLAPKIIKFSAPLMLSGLLQLSFTTVNMALVGQFRGSDSLAAIGATFNLTELLLFVFMGLSVGANVLVARYIGAKDKGGITAAVHTAITACLCGGVLFGISGFFLSTPLLRLTGTPEGIIGQSAIYMRVYFSGLPAIALYNFGSAILRATGDTKSPLYFLSFAGLINVGLTLFFVLILKSGIGGVSLASVFSQAVAAGLVLRRLMVSEADYKVRLKCLRIDWKKLWMIAQIGVPEGFQSMMFAVSNVLIQSSINAFGTAVIAGTTAAISIEGFIFATLNALPQAAIAFTGQNMGAGNYKNINRIFGLCCLFCAVACAVMCTAMVLSREELVRIFSTNPEVIAPAAQRLLVIGSAYILIMTNNIAAGIMRGMGASLLPAVVCLLGICAYRVIWVETIFRAHPTYLTLIFSYPTSWLLTLCVDLVCLAVVKRRIISRALLSA